MVMSWGVPLLNFEGPLLDFDGGGLLNLMGVPGPTFKLWGGSQVSESRGPGVLVPLLHHANKAEVGNLKLLFLLCADAYLDNTTGCFYKFRNMQQAKPFA